MKKCIRWAVFFVLLVLALPVGAEGFSLDLNKILSGIEEGVSQYAAALGQSNARDLSLVAQADKQTIVEGDVVTLEAVVTNPHLYEEAVSVRLSVAQDRFEIDGSPLEWQGKLPAATLDAKGTVEPSRTRLVWQMRVLPVPGGDDGLQELDAVVTMAQDSRYYQSAASFELLAPRISVRTNASSRTAQPEGALVYTVVCTNNGPAAGSVQVRQELPEGLKAIDLEAPAAARIEGRTLVWDVTVPAATYDGDTLVEPAHVVRIAKVEVEAGVLDGVSSGRKVLVSDVTANGERLTPQRLTVQGPLLSLQIECGVQNVRAGDEIPVALIVSNKGRADADVTLQTVLPKGMALSRFVTRGMHNKISGQTLSWQVHLDAAQMGLDGRLVPTQERIEFVAKAQAVGEGERQRLLGVFSTYRAGNQAPGISNVAQVTLSRTTFLGATQEEWAALFWATLLLLVTGVCLYCTIRREK